MAEHGGEDEKRGVHAVFAVVFPVLKRRDLEHLRRYCQRHLCGGTFLFLRTLRGRQGFE